MRFPRSYVHALTLAGVDHRTLRVLTPFHIHGKDPIPSDIEVAAELDPTDHSVLDGAAGLVIPGGGDIDPEWYGKQRHARTRNVSHKRDQFELTLLEEALRRDMPVLAICHGMQLLNVHLGGSLDQHLADEPGRLDHDRDRPRADPAHHLRIESDSLLAEILGGTETRINSHHHQGLDVVAEALQEVAWAEDGVLEAIVSTDHAWVVGVQWHPEVMAPVDNRQGAIFDAFVTAAQARGEPNGRAARARSEAAGRAAARTA